MTMADAPSLLREIAAHMATTPPAVLGPLLWGGGLLFLLRRFERRPPLEERRVTPAAKPTAADLRSAA
jgi:glycosyltransferase A (GT-A) superfamily protein (DUF2064 family)